jgi:dephospho-CoA kinase
MTPSIIAICGLKRSGKDTIADALCHDYGYQKVKIATPLKEALKTLFKLTDSQVEGNEKDMVDPRWGIEPRKLMQFIGTEVMQYHLQEVLPNVGRTFWIKLLIEEHIANNKQFDKKFVIPDLRFKHEYDLLAQHNAVFWRVERFEKESIHETHSSEIEYLDIPVEHVFKNEGSKEELEHLVRSHICELVKSHSHISR